MAIGHSCGRPRIDESPAGVGDVGSVYKMWSSFEKLSVVESKSIKTRETLAFNMKIVVVVGLFVLVSCLSLQANGAEYRGKTDDCKNPPEGLANTCHRFLCDDESGEYTVQTCGVAAVSCPEGTVEEHPAEDLTKAYPDCCSRPRCRSA